MDEKIIEILIFGKYDRSPRYTQDSPIYPDVWMEYFKHISMIDTYRVDLILTPHKKSSASELISELASPLDDAGILERFEIASNGDTVVAKMTFAELIHFALPLTNWWKNYLTIDGEFTDDYRWLARLVGAFQLTSKDFNPTESGLPEILDVLEKEGTKFIRQNLSLFWPKEDSPKLWAVSKNRPATLSIELSVPATKADAGRRLFEDRKSVV